MGQVAELGEIERFIQWIIVAVLFTLLSVISVTITQSVKERRTELAVFRSLGFTKVRVGSLILLESCLMCIVPCAVGLVAGAVLFPDVFERFGLGMQELSYGVVAAGAAIAVSMASVVAAAGWLNLRAGIAEELRA